MPERQSPPERSVPIPPSTDPYTDATVLRVHNMLDALETAFERHARLHPSRVLACEMCDLRGSIAAFDLIYGLAKARRSDDPAHSDGSGRG